MPWRSEKQAPVGQTTFARQRPARVTCRCQLYRLYWRADHPGGQGAIISRACGVTNQIDVLVITFCLCRDCALERISLFSQDSMNQLTQVFLRVFGFPDFDQ